jgi:chromate transporter
MWIVSIRTAGSIFLAFLRMGCTGFGGPLAHLGHFRQEFVQRRQWLDDRAYADLVSLCQVLPGPASSQVGIALGYLRGGWAGSLAAWLGFTLPSAALMTVLGMALGRWGLGSASGTVLHGLKLVAVAVIAQAIWGMGQKLCPDAGRATLAVLACAAGSLLPGVAGQLGVLAGGAFAGRLWLSGASLPRSASAGTLALAPGMGARAGARLLALFALFLLLALTGFFDAQPVLALFDRCYRAGALVFGGGHVVLPLLQTGFVANGRVEPDVFLAGYGAAQALPGPLFTFAAFLGARQADLPHGLAGALVALLGIFLPGYLLVLGTLPFWDRARHHAAMARAMDGVNAAVVGLLLATFYQAAWSGTVHNAADFSLALAAFLLMQWWKLPAWALVLAAALWSTGAAFMA